MAVLWHYTCAHVAARVARRGMLVPNRQLVLPGVPRLLWLTPADGPTFREALGLTSHYIRCDRMAFRYVVREHDARPFLDYARDRGWSDREWRAELGQGAADPALWYVLDHAALGTLDRAYSPIPHRAAGRF